MLNPAALTLVTALAVLPTTASSPGGAGAASGRRPQALAHDAHHHHAKKKKDAPAKDEVKAPGDARVGDKTRCVVSGDLFTVEKDTAKVEHEGKSYYLCCDDCIEQFKADPAKYVGKTEAKH